MEIEYHSTIRIYEVEFLMMNTFFSKQGYFLSKLCLNKKYLHQYCWFTFVYESLEEKYPFSLLKSKRPKLPKYINNHILWMNSAAL